MQEGHNKLKDRFAALLGWLISLLAWMMALALLYTVFLKCKLLFH
jgi:hypothetical protein